MQIVNALQRTPGNALTDEERLQANMLASQIANTAPWSRQRKEILLWLDMVCSGEIDLVENLATVGGLDTFTERTNLQESPSRNPDASNRVCAAGNPPNTPCYAVAPYKVPAWLMTPPCPSGISETDWTLMMIKEESKVNGWTLYAIALHAHKLEDDVDQRQRREDLHKLLHPFRVEQLKPVIELIEAQKPEVKKFLKRMQLPQSMATLEARIKTK
jgi:hypothetical protein